MRAGAAHVNWLTRPGLLCRFAVLLVGMAAALLPLSAGLATNLLSVDLLHAETGTGSRLLPAQRMTLSSFVGNISISYRRVLAATECAHGDFDACEARYRLAVARQPADVIASFRLANLLAQTGRESEAITWWARAGCGRYWSARGDGQPGCDDVAPGLQYLFRAVLIDPSDGINQLRLGKRLVQCEKWQEAMAPLSMAIESGDLSSLELHGVFLNRAMAIYYGGWGLEAALADIDNAIRLQPKNPWSYLRLSAIYRAEKRLTEALAAAETAIALSPSLAYAYYYRGRVWHDMGDLAHAQADYERALALDPTIAAARTLLEQVRRERQ